MNAYAIKAKNKSATISRRSVHRNDREGSTSLNQLVAAIRENDSLTDRDCRRLGFTEAFLEQYGPIAIKKANDDSVRSVGE